MQPVFPISEIEHRDVDGFDLIYVLGLMKEYNWKHIWKRYVPKTDRPDTISMYVASSHYFMELHIQQMQRIILSEKFNTNPFFLQQVIQRMTAGHDHDLILEKIQKQGMDTGDNPVSLSCSLGATIVDFIANKNEPFLTRPQEPYGQTFVEQSEKRALDIFDLSSTLYLCQQNLSHVIFRRYGIKQASGKYAPEVRLQSRVGDYDIDLLFYLLPIQRELVIPPLGNISAFTMHQVLERMFFRHSPDLILSEFSRVGLTIPTEHLSSEFTLSRYINDTALRLHIRKGEFRT